MKGRQLIVAVLIGAGLIYLAQGKHWPFVAAYSSEDYPHPTLWQLLLTDRYTLGLVRLSLVAAGVFIVVSIPALMIAGRWVKGFGKDGLTVDDAQAAADAVGELKKKLENVTSKYEAASEQVTTLTHERDEARRLAREALENAKD